jgi:2-dehydropantoate 2-reductase
VRPKIAVLGTGANGAGIGADMINAGHDVTFIEQWPENVEAMRERGVTVTLLSKGTTTVTPVTAYHVCQVAELREKFDIVFVLLKAYDTRWGVELIKPLVADDGVVIGLQNGMSLDDVADIMGPERALGAVIELGANMFEPGVVERHNAHDITWFALGSENPVAHAKAERAADVLRAAGTVVVSDDIRSAKWMKLVLNAAELVPSAILDLPIRAAAEVPGMRELMLEAGHEALRACYASGSKVVPIFGQKEADPETFVEEIFGILLDVYSLPSTMTTVLHDWRKRRRSEVNEINGLVVDVLGPAQAPVNAAFVEIAHRIERHDIDPDIANADAVKELLARAPQPTGSR